MRAREEKISRKEGERFGRAKEGRQEARGKEIWLGINLFFLASM